MVNPELVCNRCGKCCHWVVNGVRRRCKYLQDSVEGRTYCRIYNRRMGIVLDYDEQHRPITCNYRYQVKLNYEGCPNNNVNQE